VTDESRKYLEKAEHALKVARDLLQLGHASDAVSRAYYAMFYAAQALLKSEGIEVIKHSGVESSFGYHFIKTGRIDSKYHKMLIRARRAREVADYDLQEETTESAASEIIEDCRDFLDTIKAVLGCS